MRAGRASRQLRTDRFGDHAVFQRHAIPIGKQLAEPGVNTTKPEVAPDHVHLTVNSRRSKILSNKSLDSCWPAPASNVRFIRWSQTGPPYRERPLNQKSPARIMALNELRVFSDTVGTPEPASIELVCFVVIASIAIRRRPQFIS